MSSAACANCGRAIRHPAKDSYPAGVRWVHDVSPVGAGNRYCDFGGSVAQPAECACDPDDPCHCFPERSNPPPRYKVRQSAQYVEQVRDLSGDRRYPLKPVRGVS